MSNAHLIETIMTKEVITVAADSAIEEALGKMTEGLISCLVVCQESTPIGIVTERDLTRVLKDQLAGGEIPDLVSQVMSSPVTMIDAHDNIELAVAAIRDKRIRHLVVVNSEGHIAGIVTQTDLLDAHARSLEERVATRSAELEQALKVSEDANQSKSEMFTTVMKTIEEISACLEQVAERCSNAGSSAKQTQQIAERASEEAAETARQAAEIVTASGAIEHVASRTRLLALNAKIEASRAGEFGRGFNVVANEVKQLSSEAMESSQEIDRVAGSIEKSMADATEAVDEIAKAAAIASDESTELVHAAREQKEALDALLKQLGSECSGTTDLF